MATEVYYCRGNALLFCGNQSTSGACMGHVVQVFDRPLWQGTTLAGEGLTSPPAKFQKYGRKS